MTAKSTILLIQVAIPFLDLCLSQLHSFNLMDSLLPEFSEQLCIAKEVQKARSHAIDLSYCLKSFGHLVRWRLKDNFAPTWAIDALDSVEQYGGKFGSIRSEKAKIRNLFEPSWDFDCPICGDLESAVTQLGETDLRVANIVPVRLVCVNCGFATRDTDFFLSETILADQVTRYNQQILREYGIR